MSYARFLSSSPILNILTFYETSPPPFFKEGAGGWSHQSASQKTQGVNPKTQSVNQKTQSVNQNTQGANQKTQGVNQILESGSPQTHTLLSHS